MAAYRWVDDLRSSAGWLPVHRDQLRAQSSVSSMGSLYLYLFWVPLTKLAFTCTKTILIPHDYDIKTKMTTITTIMTANVCNMHMVATKKLRPLWFTATSSKRLNQLAQFLTYFQRRFVPNTSVDSKFIRLITQSGATAWRKTATWILSTTATGISTKDVQQNRTVVE